MPTTPSSTHAPQLLTVSRIAERLGVSIKRVEYVLRTRPHIGPAAKAKHWRLYDEGGLTLIQMELQEIEAKRAERSRRRQRGGASRGCSLKRNGGADDPRLFH